VIAEDRSIRFGLTVADDDVYRCFCETAPEDLEAFAHRVIKTGAQVLCYSQAIGGADHVARQFETLARQMDELLRKTGEQLNATIVERFDPTRTGSYTAHLHQSLPRLLSDVLSLDKDSAPLARLKREMEGEIRAVGNLLRAQASRSEVVQMTTLKGVEFEERLADALLRGKAPGDTLDDVRNHRGKLGKKGDFTIDVEHDPLQRIVIESKDERRLTSKTACDILAEAMDNRAAQFGIFVFASEELLPRDCACWQLYNDNKVVCSFDDDGLCLEIALRYARGQVRAWTEKQGVDSDRIWDQLDKARRMMQRLATARQEAESLQKAAARVAQMVREVEGGVREVIGDIEKCL